MEKNLIAIRTLCSRYQIEFSFIDALHNTGLIQIEIIEQDQFIDQDQLGDLEKMIRLHHELNVNIEGIDVVFNLLEKEKELRKELTALENKLKLYENDKT
jgi:ABC-type Fe3+-citrate transport system substrate-binding protein